MKTVAKTLLIIKIVASILYVFAFGFLMAISFYMMKQGEIANTAFGEVSWWFIIASQIAGIIVSIVSLFIVCRALKVLNHATCKKDIKSIAIITLIFGSPIAGIVMLLLKDEHIVKPLF